MSDRLRILISPDWYPTQSDPVNGAFVRDQAQALARHHDVTVLFHDDSLEPRGQRSPVQRGYEDEVSVIRIRARGPRGSRLSKLGFVLSAHRLLREMQRAGRSPDVIHAHGFSAAALMLAATRGAFPVVVTEHFSDFLEGLVQGRDAWIARYVFRHAATVCAVSKPLGESVLRLEPRAKVAVVPNVIDASPFLAVRRSGAPHDPPVVLVVATLERQKGLNTLIDAAASLRVGGTRFRVEVVGDGSLRAELEVRAHDLISRGTMTFQGACSRADVSRAMADADVFVLPSVVETFGVALFEAAVAGLPVVTTCAVPAFDEIGDQFGIAVPPGDVSALAAAIREVLHGGRVGPDPSRRAELASRFGSDALLERLDPIYRAALTR